jgi:hypothetical protein
MSDDKAVQSPSSGVHGAARHRTVEAGRAARRDLGKKLLKLIGYLVVGYLILRLIPSLERAIGSLERVRWQWLVVAFALEVASEMGFVVAWHAIVDPEDQLGGEGRGERTDTRSRGCSWGAECSYPEARSRALASARRSCITSACRTG